ncbi:MAG: DNA alkylation repair protein [Nitrospirota bacterium]
MTRTVTVQKIQKRLRSFASKEKAALLMGFFKTGPGQYGEGDKFLGVMVPQTRIVVKEFRDAPLPEIAKLLRSPWHEDRLCALLLLVHQFERGSEALRKTIYTLYLKNTRFINNWDLVDLSAPRIVGIYLEDRSRKPLYRLVRSRSLWGRRIAILGTFPYIRKGDFVDALALAEKLIDDDHDLMHKAVGWMLREVGKKDVKVLEGFLKKHHQRMPRTALRYAIERFPEAKRKRYLSGIF